MTFLITIFFSIISIASIINECSSFQVEPDRAKLFKNAIESTVEHPVPKPVDIGSARTIPMITVFDDDSYSPVTPTIGAFLSSISNVFRNSKSVRSSSSPKNENDSASSSFETDYYRPRPLFESFDFGHNRIPPTKRAVPRKAFGCDSNPSEYWFNNRIHSFGNTGFLGAFHAAVAPLATTMIDLVAYDKLDVRTAVSKELAVVINKSKARVLDLCCGVGISTRALKATFHDAEAVIGIDTSPEMIGTARAWTRHEIAMKYINVLLKQTSTLARNLDKVTTNADLEENGISLSEALTEWTSAMFARGNAERTIFPAGSFDLVTIMYGFHEIPKLGRYRILREVRRILQDGGTLALVDICPEYEPSESMLLGEPYVVEYQRNIHKQMKSIQGFTNLRYKVVIPGHVGMWLLTRKALSSSSNTSPMPPTKLPF